MKSRKQIHRVWYEIKKKCNLDTQFTICSDWLLFDNFYNWYISQQGWELDFGVVPDIVYKHNKHYSADNCILIPHHLNSSIARVDNRDKIDKLLPVGIDISQGKYRVRCRYLENGVRYKKDLGRFDTLDQATYTYREFKNSKTTQLVEEWKSRVSEKAYLAIKHYTI